MSKHLKVITQAYRLLNKIHPIPYLNKYIFLMTNAFVVVVCFVVCGGPGQREADNQSTCLWLKSNPGHFGLQANVYPVSQTG